MTSSSLIRLVSCVLFMGLAGAPPARTASDQIPAGMIVELHGDKVYLRSSSSRPDEQGKPLGASALGRIVYLDEIIVCGANGSRARVHVNVSIAKGDTDLTCEGDKTRIEFKRSATDGPPRGAEVRSPENVMQGYKIAGRGKGSDSAIFSPPDGGAVTAGGLVVRWRTRPPLPALVAILRDGAGRELARAAEVDGATGLLDSPAFREALTKYRDAGDGEHRARLVFQSGSGPETGVTFTVLTKEQEGALNQALASQSSSAGLFHHVERAAIFDSYRMYGSVAAEYDAALQQAPESFDLLRAALTAHSRIGDLRRALELRNKLQELETSSPPEGRR
jgi:hypothetical protein